MELQTVTYQAGDLRLTGTLADGSNGRQVPGIIIAHEAGGLGEHTRERAAMLAEEGYVAFALDLFGEHDLPLERARELTLALRADIPEMRSRMSAALDVVRNHPGVDGARLAAIGYCLGGLAAVELARSGADLRCILGFHSGFPSPDLAASKRIKAKALFCHGADDPVITADQRDAFLAELNEAKVDWQLHLYGGVGHSFTNRAAAEWGFAGFAFDASADRRAWRAMLALFEECF